jgi:hypothetical protein
MKHQFVTALFFGEIKSLLCVLLDLTEGSLSLSFGMDPLS